MKDDKILGLLEEAAKSLSVTVEYDDLKKGAVNTHGGAYILRGEKRILLHKYLSTQEKAELLAEILSGMDAGALLPPEVRRILQSAAPPGQRRRQAEEAASS
ncbi:MAG: hypothetical protein HY954_10305 [Deltaproteobacteria bacterium]|nr:hypothetical protein [Deltaproteobacteria bacterium]